MAYYLSNGAIPADEFEAICKNIHQTPVNEMILNQTQNNVILDQPSTIDLCKKHSQGPSIRPI